MGETVFIMSKKSLKIVVELELISVFYLPYKQGRKVF